MTPRLELAGQTFGAWLVLESVPKERGKTSWRCRCQCGVEAVVRGAHLMSGRSRSCGDSLHQRSARVDAGRGVRGAGDLLPGGADMRRIEAGDGAPEVQRAAVAVEEVSRARRAGAVRGGVADGHLDDGGGEDLRGRDVGGRGPLGEESSVHGPQDTAVRVVDADVVGSDDRSPAALKANGWHFSSTLLTWVRNVTPPADREDGRAMCDADPWVWRW